MGWWKGYIYIVKAGNGLYKIGHATRVEKRIRKLPFEVELIHSIDADNVLQAEKMLHYRYRKFLVGGEWFQLSSKEIGELKGLIHIPEQDDRRPRTIGIRNLSQNTVDSLNAQAANLGYKSRERYLQDILALIAITPVETIEKAIEAGRLKPRH